MTISLCKIELPLYINSKTFQSLSSYCTYSGKQGKRREAYKACQITNIHTTKVQGHISERDLTFEAMHLYMYNIALHPATYKHRYIHIDFSPFHFLVF